MEKGVTIFRFLSFPVTRETKWRIREKDFQKRDALDGEAENRGTGKPWLQKYSLIIQNSIFVIFRLG